MDKIQDFQTIANELTGLDLRDFFSYKKGNLSIKKYINLKSVFIFYYFN